MPLSPQNSHGVGFGRREPRLAPASGIGARTATAERFRCCHSENTSHPSSVHRRRERPSLLRTPSRPIVMTFHVSRQRLAGNKFAPR